MSELGIERSQVIIARSVEQMVSYLRQGKVDWVTETLGTGLRLQQLTGASVIARRWKGGAETYQSLVIVRKDNQIDALSDLKGKTIAFERNNSTTGFLIPASAIVHEQLPLTLMASPLERPPANIVGYFFSNEEINTSSWVHKGIVDAGCISSSDWTNPRAVPEEYKSDLRVIYRSPDLPRTLELVRPSLPDEHQRKLLEVLLLADSSLAGQTAMKAFANTTKFELFDPPQWPALDQIRSDIATLLQSLSR